MCHVVERNELVLAVLHRGEQTQSFSEQLSRAVVLATLLRQDAKIQGSDAPDVGHSSRASDRDGSAERFRRLVETRLKLRRDTHVAVHAALTTYVADRLVQGQCALVCGICARGRFGNAGRSEA